MKKAVERSYIRLWEKMSFLYYFLGVVALLIRIIMVINIQDMHTFIYFI